MQNYYEVLQVLRSAEQEVIKAAYRTLARRYHPDSFEGDKAFANSRMQAINEAYEVLGDPGRRAAYDQKCGETNADDSFFSEADEADRDFAQRWQIAAKYCPEADVGFKYLEKLSSRLAFSFGSYLLETQGFDQSSKLVRKFEGNFLTLYFGANREIQAFARQLLFCGERGAAKALNAAIKVLGKSLGYENVSKIIGADYPAAAKKLLYFKVFHSKPFDAIVSCRDFLNGMSVETKISGSYWDSDRLVFEWNNEKLRVLSNEARRWVIQHFDDREEFRDIWRGPKLWE